MDVSDPNESATARKLIDLASSLQSALSTTEVEQAFLTSVPGLLPADGHGIYRIDPETSEPISISADVAETFKFRYAEYGRFDDPVMDRVRQFRQPADSSQFGDLKAWRDSATGTIMADEDLEHSLRAPIEIAGQLCGTVSFARGRGTRQFDQDDRRIARRISEQMSLALERAARFEAAERRSTVMEDALDHLPQGIIIADSAGRTIFANRAASAPQPGYRRPYSHLVADYLRATAEELWRKNRRVNTANIRDLASGASLVAKSVKLTNKSSASVTLVYPADPTDERRQLPVWDVLTPREQEIAEFISAGLTTKQIAARAFVSENTVKQHLKRIFAKTDVRNRAELMQRVWASNAPASRPPATGETA